MSEPSSSHPRATVVDAFFLIAILIGMLHGIDRYSLYEPHEGHFAGVGREMYLSGDWITPKLDGAPYLNKPPLFYWMIATSYTIFGVSEWAARLPQALIGWMGVVFAWLWARELFGSRAGRIAAGMLAVSAGWYLFSHQLLIDELLSVIYFASLYYMWRIARNPEPLGGWVGYYITMGLSIMAKGLVGPMLSIVALLCFIWLKKEKRITRYSRPWLGVLISFAIVLPWLVMIELRNPGFLKYVIVNEHWNRLFNKRDPPDFEPVRVGMFTYILIALVWLAPWCLFLPQVASFAWKNSHPSPLGGRGAGGEGEEPRHDLNRANAIAILSLGALIPAVLFIPVPSRLIYYSLPALPPFAVLASGWWVAASGDCYKRGRISAGATAIVLGLAIIASAQFIAPLVGHIRDIAAVPQIIPYMSPFALVIGLGLLSCGVILLNRRAGMAMVVLCGCLLIGEAYNTRGFAEFDRIRSSKRLVNWLLPRAGADAVWISEGSLEIGAAGGIAFNLGIDGQGKPRRVYVMSDSPMRNPPRFPGSPPEYLIDKVKLKELWSSKTPAIYITDFQRLTDDDKVREPPSPHHEIHFDPNDNPGGLRRVFVNEAARHRFGL